jgi:protein-tyrosine phosphatase
MSSILFVCTGNICRSPSAEALLRHQLQDTDHQIDSAGTHGYHIGSQPDKRAIKLLKAKNISVEGITARKVMSQDFEVFDHVIAMDQGHFDILKELTPKGSRSSITLFSEYCADFTNKDVPDPYYGYERDFERMMAILEDGIEGIMKLL